MMFRIVENDDTNENTTITKNTETISNDDMCFICFETDFPLIKLNSQNNYYKTCSCDGIIHKNCLDKWYDNKKDCPICRKPMEYKTILKNIKYFGTKLKHFMFICFISIGVTFIFISFISFIFLILY